MASCDTNVDTGHKTETVAMTAAQRAARQTHFFLILDAATLKVAVGRSSSVVASFLIMYLFTLWRSVLLPLRGRA